MDPKQLKEIMELVAQAYQNAGSSIETAILIQGDEVELLVDNRKPEAIN